jgi:hypothetical protein
VAAIPAAPRGTEGAPVSNFATMLTDAVAAPVLSVAPADQLPTTDLTRASVNELPRFNRATPGAFHPATAYQKPMMDVVAYDAQVPATDIQLAEMIPLKPASRTLLALLNVVAAPADEPEAETLTAVEMAADVPLPVPQMAVQPLPIKSDVASLPVVATAPMTLAVEKPLADTSELDEPNDHDVRPETVEGAKSSLFDRMVAKAEPAPATRAALDVHMSSIGATPLQNAPSPVVDAAKTDTLARAVAAPLAQVPHIIAIEARKMDASGMREFTIRLDPAELGRIDVKLEVKADGYVTATVQADQSSTFDLLRQDARGFEQALADSGLKTNSDSLNFSLRRDAESAFAQLMSGGEQRSGRHGSKAGSRIGAAVENSEQKSVANHRLSLSQIDVMA